LGFVPKWAVIRLTRSTNIFFTLRFLILGSLISLFYYLSLMFSAFFSTGPVILLRVYLQVYKKRKFLTFNLILGMFINLLGGLFLLRNFFMWDFIYAMGLFNEP
jgi:NADH:ubiquinone oxidoreductase subunit 2 (subunit N)